jgi:hypothetical protein
MSKKKENTMNDLIIVADGFRAFQKKSRDVKLVRQLEKLGTSESLLLAAQIRQQHIKKEDDLPKVFAAYKCLISIFLAGERGTRGQ